MMLTVMKFILEFLLVTRKKFSTAFVDAFDIRNLMTLLFQCRCKKQTVFATHGHNSYS